jgi:hypothetical protein
VQQNKSKENSKTTIKSILLTQALFTIFLPRIKKPNYLSTFEPHLMFEALLSKLRNIMWKQHFIVFELHTTINIGSKSNQQTKA